MREQHSLLDPGWALSAQEVSSIGAITYQHMASNRNQVKPSRNQKHLGHSSLFHLNMQAGRLQSQVNLLDRACRLETEICELQGEL